MYTLILLRHGESEWNVANRYTGWCDVDLTERGEDEARSAGRLLRENGIEVDHCFASVLKRASFTANMCLNMAGQQLSAAEDSAEGGMWGFGGCCFRSCSQRRTESNAAHA